MNYRQSISGLPRVVRRHIELNVVERDPYAFTAKSEEDVLTDGWRRIQLRISRREEPSRLGRRTAVEVKRALGVPSWCAAYRLVLTCMPRCQSIKLILNSLRRFQQKSELTAQRTPRDALCLRPYFRVTRHIMLVAKKITELCCEQRISLGRRRCGSEQRRC